jgi:alanine racemase
MGRLGLTVDEAAELAAQSAGGAIRVVGVMTHFACADIDDPAVADSSTYAQLARFTVATKRLAAAVPGPLVRHAANSSGAMLFPGSRLDLVRCGLALYGNGHWGTDDVVADPRRQAMRLVTRIAQIRTVQVGDRVGYGGLWTATRRTRAAVLPLGYADGLPRRATGHASVLIAGHRCPLIGAVSMDIAIADVSDVPAAQIGDRVVVLGVDGSERITAADFSSWTGLSEYEVTCGISKRVPRTYVESFS